MSYTRDVLERTGDNRRATLVRIETFDVTNFRLTGPPVLPMLPSVLQSSPLPCRRWLES